ncbi:hypothetical protein [Dietzia maris]|uniref:Transposase n=1 Tax=Dietzia maris TaxID=37915 RepID=A0ABT8GXM0_9ACTN|nr:hypothetical protein [Dietzia maris]MDN4504952.1 hypothetical protein [Dietzia maris]
MTRSWVQSCGNHWHNNDRLHGYLNDVPPAEFEETFCATKRADQTLRNPIARASVKPSAIQRGWTGRNKFERETADWVK